ncbi:oligosaccharide flippase family protein [Nocardioides sp.]|uniref:oligosaccharide flippase family protein n=1 Tax=Nocardioides sp. TaxID=35761 RepID=UPI0035685CB9
MTVPVPESDEQAASSSQGPSWTLGDRRASIAVLFPAAPASVVVATSDEVSIHLQAALRHARVLTDDPTAAAWPDPDRVMVWDDLAAGIEPGTVELVVVDVDAVSPERVEAVKALVAPEGTLAVIGRGGPYLVYPSLASPEMVWCRGWPVDALAGPLAWARRRLGLSLGGLRSAVRISVEGPAPSLADEVLAEIEARTGGSVRLVGVVTASHAVLRVRGDHGDLAVRLSLTDDDRDDAQVERVAADVPDVVRFLPRAVASGRVGSHPWVAQEWAPRRRRPFGWPWPDPERRWQVADELIAVLSAHPTGAISPGWADRWAGLVAMVPKEVQAEFAELMRPLESGLPTAWCHGDLWPPNVLIDEGRAVVIDWDNATSEAPQGIDALLLPGLRAAGDPDRSTVSVVLGLVDDVEALRDVEVAGRAWQDWERPERLALAVAAVLLHLRNRSPLDLAGAALDRHVAEIRATATPEPPGGSVAAEDASRTGRGEATRTARGALWLATNGIVVKASQTIVLLTLAAILEPSALGLVAIGTLVANIAAKLSTLGTSSALIYWRGDVDRASRTALTIGVVLGSVLAALLWMIAPWLAGSLRAGDGGADVVRGLTVVMPFMAISAVSAEMLRRELRFLRRIIPDSTGAVVGAVVAIVLVSQGQGVMALVAGQIVQATLAMLLFWVVRPPIRPGWNRQDAQGLLSYGGPYAGGGLLELVQLNVDYLIVARVLGAAALGQYSLAYRLAFMPYLMIVVVTAGAAFPFLCRQRGEQLGRAAVVVMTATLTLVAPLLAGVVLFADHLTLLGDKWAPGVPVVAWLAVYATLLSVGLLVQVSLNASGRPLLTMGLKLLHLALLFGTLVVIARHGIVVVAIGEVLVMALVAAIGLFAAQRLVAGFRVSDLLTSLRPALIGVVSMSVVVLAVRAAFGVDEASVTGLLAVGTLGVIAFAVPVWMLDRVRLGEAARLMRGQS